MKIEHNIELQEDKLTLKGKILKTIFENEEKRGDNIKHYLNNKTNYICSSFSPALTKYTLLVWGEIEECDNFEVNRKFDSERDALKMLKFINQFSIDKKDEIIEEPKQIKKNWTGNKNSIYTRIGASNHSDGEREEHDFYATSPKAVELLLELESFDNKILEPCCGRGDISKVLEKSGYEVVSMDLIDRGYGTGGIDFLKVNKKWDGSIITNPPYSLAQSFVEKSLEIIPKGKKVAMFLKLTFLEGKKRKEFFKENPPIRIWVSSSRLICAKNGDFEKYPSSAIAYCWYIWEKGYKGDITIKHFN